MSNEQAGLTILCGGCGSKGRRFVSQFFIGPRVRREYVSGGWGWFGLDGLGRDWPGHLLFSGLL
jgi:hypothetical protein